MEGKTAGGTPPVKERIGRGPEMVDLAIRYFALGEQSELGWDSKYEGMTVIGKGGQGIVFRCDRAGSDGFRVPVALKIFSPEVYARVVDYDTDMVRVASVSKRVAQLQNSHLLDVHNFISSDHIRVMVMEWVNGYDLQHLLDPKMLVAVRTKASAAEWDHLNDVVITDGPQQSRLKPGVAIQILRECLTGLASLHRIGVAHGDIKPANVMLKLTGNAKLVDFGSAVDMQVPGARVLWTPAYAAPEILDGGVNSPQSDLASLGYVLVEMLSGRLLFQTQKSPEALQKFKKELPGLLDEILPPDVVRNREFLELCVRLIHPDPARRLESAQKANLDHAANLHRQLVKTDLDSEYANDLRVWMENLPARDPMTLGNSPASHSTTVRVRSELAAQETNVK